MKTKTTLQLIAISLVILITSCKKDEGTSSPKFSKLTVEQNKAEIENNGFELLNNVRDLETSQSVRAAKNMADYMMNYGYIFKHNPKIDIHVNSVPNNAFLKPIFTAANMSKFNPDQVAKDLMAIDSDTLTKLFNAIKGVYSWDSKSEEWKYTNTGNEIRMEFPSTKNGTTNNVVFRAYDCIIDTWVEGKIDLPKQLKMELKVDNNVLLSFLFKITFEKDIPIPTSVVSNLTLSNFKFSLEATNSNNTKGSVTLKFTRDNTILFKFYASAKSDWLNAESNNIGDLVSEGNVTLQLMNVKLVGDANIKAIDDKLIALEKTTTLKDSLLLAAKCDIINKDANLSLCFVDNNTIIAKIIAYPATDYDNVYNDETGQYEDVKNFDLGFRFIFADNSKVDAATYFRNGFDSLTEEAFYYLRELNNKYRLRDKM